MKRLIPLLIVLMLCVSCASTPCEGWTKANTMMAGANVVLWAADWQQTKEIARNPNYVELNPIMGSHPNQTEVDLYMLSALTVTTVVPMLLKPKWRELWQVYFIIQEGATVQNNYRIGIRF